MKHASHVPCFALFDETRMTMRLTYQALELDSITTHHWSIVDCSAVSGENLLPAMDWVVRDIGSRIFLFS
jgi:ADP-ribosylation factor-like protein 2